MNKYLALKPEPEVSPGLILAERLHRGKHIVMYYPSRKLYSKKLSIYFTQTDLMDLMSRKEEFVVLSPEGEDLTATIMRRLLTQLIITGEYTDEAVKQMVSSAIVSKRIETP